MPLYDTQIKENETALPKEIVSQIAFTDGAFYPFLKYLLKESTGCKDEDIFIKDYFENSPFLDQSGKPKIYCDLVEMDSNSLSGILYENGNTSLRASVKYRVYFCNDNFRSPVLFENALKSASEELLNTTNKFLEFNKKDNKITMPNIITMTSKRSLEKGDNLLPIVAIDVTMVGNIYYNIEKLKDIPFDEVNIQSQINTRSL